MKGAKNGALSNGVGGDYALDGAKKGYGQVVLGEESDSENSSAYHEPYKLLHKKKDYFGLLKKDGTSKSADTGEPNAAKCGAPAVACRRERSVPAAWLGCWVARPLARPYLGHRGVRRDGAAWQPRDAGPAGRRLGGAERGEARRSATWPSLEDQEAMK